MTNLLHSKGASSRTLSIPKYLEYFCHLYLVKSVKFSLFRFRSTLDSLTLFKLPDSAMYFLSQMSRLLSPSFTPSTEDMIRMRRATTGIQVRRLGFVRSSS